jgi:hypothetical protein
MEHINALCEITAEISVLKMVVRMVTIILWRIKNSRLNNMCIVVRLHGSISNI